MKIQMDNIVCTTDFSDLSNQAVPMGIALAKEFNAKLYLCHVIEWPPTGYGEAYIEFEEILQRTEDYALKELSQLIGDVGIDWEPVTMEGHVANEITRIAKEKHADLVVSSTHGRSGLKRFMLGSVTERLIRSLPCPVLSVHGKEIEFSDIEKQEIRFRKILVGCDFSADSNLAFQYALSLAQEFQSELHLAHIIEPPVYRDQFEAAAEVGEKLRQDLREQLNHKLVDMVSEEALIWCTPKTILMAGSPQEELIKYALLNDIDLIVLGVRGHGLAETLLMGSTTDRVVRKASCPVLSVRPMARLD
jgi:nucleotide-binding universal stress UspA family protein